MDPEDLNTSIQRGGASENPQSNPVFLSPPTTDQVPKSATTTAVNRSEPDYGRTFDSAQDPTTSGISSQPACDTPPFQTKITPMADPIESSVTSAPNSSGATFGHPSRLGHSQLPLMKTGNPSTMNPPCSDISDLDTGTTQQAPVIKVEADTEQSTEHRDGLILAPQHAPLSAFHQTLATRTDHKQTDIKKSPDVEKPRASHRKAHHQFRKQTFRERELANAISDDIRRRAFRAGAGENVATVGAIKTTVIPGQPDLTKKRTFASFEPSERAQVDAAESTSDHLRQRKKLRLETANLQSHPLLGDQPSAIRPGLQLEQGQHLATTLQEPKQVASEAKALLNRKNRNIVLTNCRKDINVAWDEAFNSAGVDQHVLRNAFVNAIQSSEEMVEFLKLNDNIDCDSYNSIIDMLKALTAEGSSQLPSVKSMNDLDLILCDAGATINDHAKPVVLDQLWRDFETDALNLVMPFAAPRDLELFKQNIKDTREKIEILGRAGQKMGFETWLDNRDAIEPLQRKKELREYDSMARNFMRSSAKSTETSLEKQMKTLTNDACNQAHLQLVLAQLQEILCFMITVKIGDRNSMSNVDLPPLSPRTEQSTVSRSRHGGDHSQSTQGRARGQRDQGRG